MNELGQHRVAVRHELSLEACGHEPKGDQSAHGWVDFFLQADSAAWRMVFDRQRYNWDLSKHFDSEHRV